MEEKVVEGKVNITKVLLFFMIFGFSVVLLLFLIALPEIIENYDYYYELRREYYQELIKWENSERYYKPSKPISMDYDTALGFALSWDGASIITRLVLPIFIPAWILISAIYILVISKIKIVVTDKRVTGKTHFGRSVDLPMDSISAVGTSWFNGISVATSSGVIKFVAIEKSKEIREALNGLLIKRQERKDQESKQTVSTVCSGADELKKYKELLDGGIITQEEFDAKKKQLLGL